MWTNTGTEGAIPLGGERGEPVPTSGTPGARAAPPCRRPRPGGPQHHPAVRAGWREDRRPPGSCWVPDPGSPGLALLTSCPTPRLTPHRPLAHPGAAWPIPGTTAGPSPPSPRSSSGIGRARPPTGTRSPRRPSRQTTRARRPASPPSPRRSSSKRRRTPACADWLRPRWGRVVSHSYQKT